MTNLADLASSAVHAGKNIVLTSTPYVGNVTSIINKLREDGFAIATINLAYDDSDFYGIPVIKEGKVEVRFPQSILDADVVIFDQVEVASPESIKAVNEMLNHQTLRGSEFPNLKSTIAIFTETRESTDNVAFKQNVVSGISGGRVINLVG